MFDLVHSTTSVEFWQQGEQIGRRWQFSKTTFSLAKLNHFLAKKTQNWHRHMKLADFRLDFVLSVRLLGQSGWYFFSPASILTFSLFSAGG